jgi:hypothetical protein
VAALNCGRRRADSPDIGEGEVAQPTSRKVQNKAETNRVFIGEMGNALSRCQIKTGIESQKCEKRFPPFLWDLNRRDAEAQRRIQTN